MFYYAQLFHLISVIKNFRISLFQRDSATDLLLDKAEELFFGGGGREGGYQNPFETIHSVSRSSTIKTVGL